MKNYVIHYSCDVGVCALHMLTEAYSIRKNDAKHLSSLSKVT